MQLAIFGILFIGFQELHIIHAQTVALVLSRQVRRSPVPQWKQHMIPRKKLFFGGGNSMKENHHHVHHHVHHNPNLIHPSRPVRKPLTQFLPHSSPLSSYRGPPFPHGGDDFDEGHEDINHIDIPYGKDVSHSISFGKGYVPYDTIKGSFILDQKTHHAGYHDAYIHDDFADQNEFDFSNRNGKRNDRKKFHSSRSIGKELGVKYHGSLNDATVGDKESIIEKGLNHYDNTVQKHHQSIEGAVVLPIGIPPATIGGSKEGVVLQDTVVMDEFQKTVDQFSKMWPSSMRQGAPSYTSSEAISNQQLPYHVQGSQFAPEFNQQHQQNTNPQIQQQIFADNPVIATESSTSPGSLNYQVSGWLTNVAQPKEGYAVKEEPVEQSHITPPQMQHPQSATINHQIGLSSHLVNIQR